MQAPAGPPFFFDPSDEATRRDPYALFARARREHPAWRHEGLPVVSVFRHADCQAILRDPQTWSSVFPTPPGFAPEDVPRSMLVMDPPEHTRLRGLVSLAFTPRRVRQLAPRIEAIAHELLDAALARREVDLVEALTYPLPVVVIAELIGVPAEDRARFRAWSNAIVAPLGTVFFEVASPERVATLRRVRGELEAEVLRFSSPVQMDPRLATREAQLQGVAVAAGEVVLCWLGSANRDEAVFEHADVFDIGRERKPDVAFGFGPHYCLGASLATLEAEVALRVLLARTRRFRRVDDVPLPIPPSIVFRRVTRLPVVLERA